MRFSAAGPEAAQRTAERESLDGQGVSARGASGQGGNFGTRTSGPHTASTRRSQPGDMECNVQREGKKPMDHATTASEAWICWPGCGSWHCCGDRVMRYFASGSAKTSGVLKGGGNASHEVTALVRRGRAPQLASMPVSLRTNVAGATARRGHDVWRGTSPGPRRHRASRAQGTPKQLLNR